MFKKLLTCNLRVILQLEDIFARAVTIATYHT